MHNYKFCWTCTLSVLAILVGVGLEFWCLYALLRGVK